MPYEEDVRAAFRALAVRAPEAVNVLATVRERQAGQTSADRTERRPARLMHRGRPEPQARRRLVLLAAPAAAVAAVVAVIVATVAVSGAPHAGRSTPGLPGALAELPPYYMTLGKLTPNKYSSTVATEAVIRDTATGGIAAVLRLPGPYTYITDIAGAADDRTFVLAGQATAAYGQGATAFFIASFDPANRTVTVEPLRVPSVTAPARHVDGIALNPDGRRVAIALTSMHKHGSHYVWSSQISVYSLPDGRAKTWTAANSLIGLFPEGPIDPAAMSWSGNGVLAFNGSIGSTSGDHIWLLNTATTGGSLRASSHFVVDLTGHGVWNPDGEGIVTLDGTKVVAPVYRSDKRHEETITTGGGKIKLPEPLSQVDEFSAATGKTISQFYPIEPYLETVFWTNSAGSVLVISVQHQGSQPGRLGVLVRNRFTPLPAAPPVPGGLEYPIAF